MSDSQVVHDPKFLPDTDALAVVDLTANKLRTDKAAFELISSNQAKGDLLMAQNAVAAYVLWQRGHEHEAIAVRAGVAVKTIERWCVAGAAILRTGEYVRTIAAVSAGGWMSKGMMDAATKPAGTPEEKLARLEVAAVTHAVAKGYEQDIEADEAKDRALSDETVAAIVTSLPNVTIANGEPVLATTLIANVPHVAEQFGIRRKTRVAQPDEQGAQQVHVHLKAALKDAKQIAKDAEAPYIPTPDDLSALLKLVEYLLPESQLNADITAAIDAVVSW